MFTQQSLNQSAKELVKNIFNNLATHPNYIDYHCTYKEEPTCAIINITKNGRNVNMYRFYPDFSGNLGSIAIYGIALEAHFKTINNSRNIFGFRVSDIELVTNNTIEPFVDITLE